MNNKRYMDFVPAAAKRKVAPRVKATRVAKAEVIVPKAKATSRTSVAAKTSVTSRTSVAARAQVTQRAVSTKREDARLGVIEDLGTSYKETSVEKSHFNEAKEGVRAAKAKKVGLREGVPEKPSGLTTKPKDNKTYKMPKSPFINQDKVEKRPLSKNVYRKKVEVPKEEPKGPVTIITKPEKQAHVSLIVTIILTIILGAAAGTVAFLLLPK